MRKMLTTPTPTNMIGTVLGAMMVAGMSALGLIVTGFVLKLVYIGFMIGWNIL